MVLGFELRASLLLDGHSMIRAMPWNKMEKERLEKD
jgi:hypothetical protein